MVNPGVTFILRQVSTGGTRALALAPFNLQPPQPIILGREPSCTLPLDPLLYTGVSRRHAMLNYRSDLDQWELQDLGSANHTYLNGQRLGQPQVLQVGDRFTLGQDGPEFLLDLGGGGAIRTQASLPHPGTLPAAIIANPSTGLSFTQLFPIAATGRDLSQKAFLWPMGLTVVFVVLMFTTVGHPNAFNAVLGTYLAGGAYFFIYRLCGKAKPWWLIVGTAIATIIVLLSPILGLFILVFREILPGNIEGGSLLGSFIGMFFGAGLMEELLKALPVFAVAQIAKKLPSPLKEEMGVAEPLDGILLGTASAVGFTLLETLGQYVPAIAAEAGDTAGLQLLIPRVLGSIAGHMAYSGYFGYFIGLSALKPGDRWKILLVGYLSSALLHALWNSFGASNVFLLAAIGVMSYAFLAAAILKARQLSPTRSANFATRFSGPKS